MKRLAKSHRELMRIIANIDDNQVHYPCELILRKPKSVRHLGQNAYLWGALYPAIQQHVRDTTGQLYSAEELHAFFKARLLEPSIVELGGEQRIVAGSSAKLTVGQFTEFTARIEAYFVDDLGGRLPAHPRYAAVA